MFVIEDVEEAASVAAGNKKPSKISDLKTLMECDSFLRLDSIDYESIMNTEKPLVAKDTEVSEIKSESER